MKKVKKRKEKKNPILVYPGLRYKHKKLNFFLCKIFFFQKRLKLQKRLKRLKLQINWFWIRIRKSVCDWKKNTKKILGAISKILWKIFVVAIKKMLVIQFPYMEIVWLEFFFQITKIKKKKFSVVAAQKTLKCFARVELIVQSFFFTIFFKC